MNWYQIFYWMTVSNSVKEVINVFAIAFTVVTIVSFCLYIISALGVAVVKGSDFWSENTRPRALTGWKALMQLTLGIFFPFIMLCSFSWLIYTGTPSKTDCLLIIAGGSVGEFIESDSSTQAIPGDISKFLHLSLQKELSDLSSHTKRELGIQTPKEKLLDKVKELSKEQLIEYLQADTTIAVKEQE